MADADDPADAADGSGAGDGKPDMSGGMAADVDDVDPDLAAEIEDATAPDGDVSGMDAPDELEISGDDVTVGEMYCRALTLVSNEAVKRHGSGDDMFTDGDDLDITLARQLKLDVYMNQVMEQHGGMETMPPGQALIVASGMFLATVAVSDGELVSNLLDKADEAGD